MGIGFRKPELRVTPEEFEADYRAILAASRTANPNLRLVLMDPFVLPTGPLENENIYRERRAQTDAMREVVARLAKEFDAVHVPLQDVFDASADEVTPAHWLWDGIHPLPQGHELIAREWLLAVPQSALSR